MSEKEQAKAAWNTTQNANRSWKEYFAAWAKWISNGLKTGHILWRLFKNRAKVAELFSVDNLPELYEPDEVVRPAVIAKLEIADDLAYRITPGWEWDETVTGGALWIVREDKYWSYIRYCLDNMVIPIFYRSNIVVEGPSAERRAVLPEIADVIPNKVRWSASWVSILFIVLRAIAYFRGKRQPPIEETPLSSMDAIEYNQAKGWGASSIAVPFGEMPTRWLPPSEPLTMSPAEPDLVTMEGKENVVVENGEQIMSALAAQAKAKAEELLPEENRSKICKQLAGAITQVCYRVNTRPGMYDPKAFREQMRVQCRLAMGYAVTSDPVHAVLLLSEAIAEIIGEQQPDTLARHVQLYGEVVEGLALVN